MRRRIPALALAWAALPALAQGRAPAKYRVRLDTSKGAIVIQVTRAWARRWRARTFPDDPPREPNLRGTVAFAFAVPNGRTTQVFINLRNHSPAFDRQGFAPFGKVVQGMRVADRLYAGYGERSGGGIRAGHQGPLFAGGNACLEKHFPRLDFIRRAILLRRQR
jgi:hypothetical protein